MKPPGAASLIGGTVKGLKFSSQQSHGPNATALSYMCSKRNVELGWFKMRQQNFVVCELKLTYFSVFDVESIVVVNAVFLLSISLSTIELYAIKV